MPTYLEGLGQQAGSTALNGIMGLILGGYNDERQLQQQEELQRMQIRGQKEMTDYEWEKQMKMWEATNYPAQLAMMKKAGLSPGLMYGKGGGGATTTGSASGHVGGATAATGGGQEIQQMIGMGMQREMQQAQIENLKANTDKTRVDTAKTAGADTENVQQNTKSQAAQEQQTKINTEIAKLDRRLKGETIDDMIEMTGWQLRKLTEEVDTLNRNNVTGKATQNDIIDTIKAEMFGAFIRNAMMKQDIKKSEKEIWKIQAEVENLIRKGQQEWKSLEIQGQNADQQGANMRHDQWVKDIQQSTQLPIDVIEKAIQAIILKDVMKSGALPKPNWQKGSDK